MTTQLSAVDVSQFINASDVDSTAGVQRAIAALPSAENGQELHFRSSTYAVEATPLGTWQIPNNTRIECAPGCVLSAVNTGYTYTEACGLFNGYYTEVTGGGGTLAATPSYFQATQTFSMTCAGATPVAGNYIRMVQAGGVGAGCQTFKVRSVTGVGPYTVTLDRPIVFPFVSGDTAILLSSVPQNIDLDFSGSCFQGGGNQMVEFTDGLQVKVRGLTYNYTGLNGALSTSVVGLDVGGRSNLLSDCVFNMVYNSGAYSQVTPWYIQSNEHTAAERLYINGGSTGGCLWDSYMCTVKDCWSEQLGVYGTAPPGIALTVGQLNSSSPGCRKCNVVGGGAVACTTGLYINASTDISVRGYAADYCTTGAVVGNNSTVTFEGCSFTNCSSAGISASSGSTVTVGLGCDFSGSALALYGAATFNVVQGGAPLTASLTGTAQTLPFSQSDVLLLTGAVATTIKFTAMPGMKFAVSNSGTAAATIGATTGATTVSVAANTNVWVLVTSSGTQLI